MNQLWKRMAFGVLVAACLAATVFLFLPEQPSQVATTPDTVVTDTPPLAVSVTPDDTVETTSAPVSESSAAEWNTYHGDNALRGVAETTIADTLTVHWTLLTEAPVRQPPVIHHETVFAVTSRGVVIAATLDGALVWQRDLNAPVPPGDTRGDFRIEAPITAVAGKVFVGADLGTLFALNSNTGEELWRTDIGGPVRGAPGYSDDGSRVFVINQDEGALVCLDAGSGAVLWQSTGVDRSDASPAVSGAHAVFGSCASAMHVVLTATGERVNDITIEGGGGQIAGGAALADGFAYAGVRDGRILCGDIQQGITLWITGISEDEVFATPAIHNAHVVVTSYDGRVHALNRATGEIMWQHDLEGMPTSPVIAGDKVLITADGVLFVLRLDDGERLREIRIGDEITSPAITSSIIVVGGEDGVLTGLRAAS